MFEPEDTLPGQKQGRKDLAGMLAAAVAFYFSCWIF